MGIGVSIFLIAVGAILTFAVDATLSGVSIQTIGIILMIAGALGLIVTMLVFGPRRRAGVVEERVVDDRPAPNCRHAHAVSYGVPSETMTGQPAPAGAGCFRVRRSDLVRRGSPETSTSGARTGAGPAR
jgi:hypothetical protein